MHYGTCSSREIKFRAYLKKYEAIYEVISIDFPNKEIFITNKDNDEMIVDFDDVILMQYTGLKDKSSVEIYEGDIVKYKNNHVMEVIFDTEENPSFMVEDDERLLFINKKCSYEVIGNIYENPELLEEKQ